MGPTQGEYYTLPSDRVTLWQPGVTHNGGIPNRSTIYTTISASGGDDTSIIQSALNNCPSGEVVKLNTGNFQISGDGLAMPSNVTLRGSGVNTKLLKTPSSAQAVIVFGQRFTSDKFYQSYNLASDGMKDSYTITLVSTPSSPALSTGELVLLDQSTDDTLTWWNDVNSPPGHPSRGWFSRTDRPLTQILEVASGSGTQITFSTPLHLDFKTANTAQMSRYGNGSLRQAVKWAGIEDLYVEKGDGGDSGGNIHLWGPAAYCWIKNVEASHSNGSSINFNGAFRCELRDSHIHLSDNPNPGGGGYLISMSRAASDNLVENNIVWRGNKVILMRATGGGNVIAYNYMDDGYIDYAKNFVETGLNLSHMTTAHHELFEGNQCFNFDSDSGWGNAIYGTAIRNHLTAKRRDIDSIGLSDEQNRRAIGVVRKHWWFSFLGNVLGTSGQTAPPPGGATFGYEWTGGSQAYHYMWQIGYQDGSWNNTPEAAVVNSTIRHGNYDYVSGSTVWDSGESNHNLPTSLYLTSKPAFFGSETWPWVTPEGSTKLYILPARYRFDNP